MYGGSVERILWRQSSLSNAPRMLLHACVSVGIAGEYKWANAKVDVPLQLRVDLIRVAADYAEQPERALPMPDHTYGSM
jgi:hypothetical protein|tara:strand:+ start:2687 stop:2923 length:237 start_codon:yes stop_codon:yes gene_type:complete